MWDCPYVRTAFAHITKTLHKKKRNTVAILAQGTHLPLQICRPCFRHSVFIQYIFRIIDGLCIQRGSLTPACHLCKKFEPFPKTMYLWQNFLTIRKIKFAWSPGFQAWRPGLATRPGDQAWRPDLATRPCDQAWRPGLATRPGDQAWRPGLATRPVLSRAMPGDHAWRPGLSTRPGDNSTYKNTKTYRETIILVQLLIFKNIWFQIN